jgi:coenzyme Q-binding protein COQ10
MSKHREKKRLPYTADQMFDLVADVANYPKFLPWCSEARILSRDTKDGVETMIADLVISFKVYRERFRSEVKIDRSARKIGTRYLDGPFKYMLSEWRFTPAGEGACDVEFDIDFEFKNRALQMLIGIVFEEAVRRMVAAFEGRARVLYGRSGRASV